MSSWNRFHPQCRSIALTPPNAAPGSTLATAARSIRSRGSDAMSYSPMRNVSCHARVSRPSSSRSATRFRSTPAIRSDRRVTTGNPGVAARAIRESTDGLTRFVGMPQHLVPGSLRSVNRVTILPRLTRRSVTHTGRPCASRFIDTSHDARSSVHEAMLRDSRGPHVAERTVASRRDRDGCGEPHRDQRDQRGRRRGNGRRGRERQAARRCRRRPAWNTPSATAHATRAAPQSRPSCCQLGSSTISAGTDPMNTAGTTVKTITFTTPA